MASPLVFPAADAGRLLQERLIQEDPVAAADCCAAYLAVLAAWLERLTRGVDSHLCQEAAGRALFDHVQRPARFDPSRCDLAAYLRMAARADLLTLLRRESRHQADRLDWDFVENGDDVGNLFQGDGVEDLLVRGEETAAAKEAVQRVREGCTPEEARVLELMLDAERRTEVFAAALGLEALSAAEQDREVKRHKDRLKKRLMRQGEGHG